MYYRFRVNLDELLYFRVALDQLSIDVICKRRFRILLDVKEIEERMDNLIDVKIFF